jgi:tetratricopeptide (TPR) repeat protein
MRRLSVACLFVAVLALQAAPARAAAEWTRLHSQNFTLEGDVPERDLRAVARRFEEFRETLARQFPKTRLVMASPVTIVVFAHDRDLALVNPRYGGKTVSASGFATVSRIGTSIVMSLEAGEDAYPVIYHEYTHLMLSNVLPAMPLWAEEGLAEFYSTFRLSDDGRTADIGRLIPPGELNLLRRGAWIPLSELVAADQGSPVYLDAKRRPQFYAQSWALMHYLQAGKPARFSQLKDYLHRLAAREAPVAAFNASFPDAAKLENELSDYVQKFVFLYSKVDCPERMAGDVSYSVSRMSVADSKAVQGIILLRQERFAEADARFNEALTLDQNTAWAHLGLGLGRVMQNLPAEGLASLQRGAALADQDAMAQFALGLGAMRCQAPGCAEQGGGAAAARRAFSRAVELVPEFPDALSFLGYVETVEGQLDDAERHLTAALSFLPAREDYQLHLAQVYMRQADFSKARALLGPLVAASRDPEYRESARRLLGAVADLQAAGAQRQAAAAAAASSDPTATGQPPAGSVTLVPVYRKVLDGERRVEGTLEAIECRGSGVVLVLRDASGSHRFAASSFDKIQFVTYRDDLKGPITCGPQAPGVRVYLTFRQPTAGEAQPAPGLEGVVVAVEFPPLQQ